MHGEYKVPGGKLVTIDVEVADDVLTDVRVAGDFFIEPDEALDDIDQALRGLPASSDVATIAGAIRAGLRPGAELLGFSPEAVAIALRRALGTEGGWRDHEWQIVQHGPVTPHMHLALDEVLAREVGAGRRAPTLRFWEWDRSCIIIGAFQSLRNEVDLEAAGRLGVEVVRRISGGGAMFVEPGTIITYSLYAPADLVKAMSFAESYAFLDDWVLRALKSLGIDASYKPLNDIVGPLGKIGGAAQKRLGNGAVLHHVTMAYDMDAQKMTQVLRIGREKLSDKGITSAAKRVDPLRSQTGLSREDIVERMRQTFVSLHGGEPGEISAEEYAAAEVLVREKFATREWLERIP